MITQMESVDTFKKMWEDIKKLSTTQKGLLSSSNFVTIFRKYQHILAPIFHLTEHKDLFEILDEDNVGLFL